MSRRKFNPVHVMWCRFVHQACSLSRRQRLSLRRRS
uniref:Uncharacterized protein n=1 Tax=Arundo donax TaxID=35708 RepID=A0A0A9HPN8_ARUDO